MIALSDQPWKKRNFLQKIWLSSRSYRDTIEYSRLEEYCARVIRQSQRNWFWARAVEVDSKMRRSTSGWKSIRQLQKHGGGWTNEANNTKTHQKWGWPTLQGICIGTQEVDGPLWKGFKCCEWFRLSCSWWWEATSNSYWWIYHQMKRSWSWLWTLSSKVKHVEELI